MQQSHQVAGRELHEQGERALFAQKTSAALPLTERNLIHFDTLQRSAGFQNQVAPPVNVLVENYVEQQGDQPQQKQQQQHQQQQRQSRGSEHPDQHSCGGSDWSNLRFHSTFIDVVTDNATDQVSPRPASDPGDDRKRLVPAFFASEHAYVTKLSKQGRLESSAFSARLPARGNTEKGPRRSTSRASDSTDADDVDLILETAACAEAEEAARQSSQLLTCDRTLTLPRRRLMLSAILEITDPLDDVRLKSIAGRAVPGAQDTFGAAWQPANQLRDSLLSTPSQAMDTGGIDAFDNNKNFVNPGNLGHPELCSRPCIFFAQGRCENGSNCGYCHLPHLARPPHPDKKQRNILKSMRYGQVLEIVLPIIKHKAKSLGVDGSKWREVEQAILSRDDRAEACGVAAVPSSWSPKEMRKVVATLTGMDMRSLLGVIQKASDAVSEQHSMSTVQQVRHLLFATTDGRLA